MRVLIVDDVQVVRAGVRALLAGESEIEVCGEAIDGWDAIVKAKEFLPDAVVMDISMPNLGGIEATRQLVSLFPKIRVVILSLHDFPHIMQQALNAGASAYVVKSSLKTDLVKALKDNASSHRMPIYGSTRTDTKIEEMLRRSAALEAALRASEERSKETEERLRKSQQELAMDFEDFKLLQRISNELIQQGSVTDLYEKIADAAVTIMRSDFASMQMLYPERGNGGELLLLAYRGFSPEAARFWEWVPANSGSTCAVALRTSSRVIVSDIETCDFMAGTEDLRVYRQTAIRAVQSTPLHSRTGQVVGMISTHWRERHAPSERDLWIFDVLARQAADLIERRRAEEAAQEKEEQLRVLAAGLESRSIDVHDIRQRRIEAGKPEA
jgi:DNA-binding NarL/FixJ family response regulator